MFFIDFLKSFSTRDEKKQLLLKTLEYLPIDDNQKELYKESIDILNKEKFQEFYKRIQETLENFENSQQNKQYKTVSSLDIIHQEETQTLENEKNNAQILLNNL